MRSSRRRVARKPACRCICCSCDTPAPPSSQSHISYSTETYQQRHEIGKRRSTKNVVTYNLNTAFSTDLCTRKSLISSTVNVDTADGSTKKEENNNSDLKPTLEPVTVAHPLRTSSRHACADAKARMQALILTYASSRTWKLSTPSNRKVSPPSDRTGAANLHSPSLKSSTCPQKVVPCNKNSYPSSSSKCCDGTNTECDAVLEACLSLLCDRALAHNLRHHHPCLKEVALAIKNSENISSALDSNSSTANFHVSRYNCKTRRKSISDDLWEWIGPPNDNFVMLPDDVAVLKRCYCAMRHQEDGLVIRVHDCVLVRSGFREKPFVAKITALYQEDDQKMMTLLWYYRPEHTPQGRYGNHQYIEQEVFASRHRDFCSVTCIENKAYVLPSRAFARYSAEICRRSQHRTCGPSNINGTNMSLTITPSGQADTQTANCGLIEDADVSSCHSLQDKVSTCEFPDDISSSNVLLCRAIYDVKLRRVILHPEVNHLMPDTYQAVQQLQILHQQHRQPSQLSTLSPFCFRDIGAVEHHPMPVIEATKTLNLTAIKSEPIKSECFIISPISGQCTQTSGSIPKDVIHSNTTDTTNMMKNRKRKCSTPTDVDNPDGEGSRSRPLAANLPLEQCGLTQHSIEERPSQQSTSKAESSDKNENKRRKIICRK